VRDEPLARNIPPFSTEASFLWFSSNTQVAPEFKPVFFLGLGHLQFSISTPCGEYERFSNPFSSDHSRRFSLYRNTRTFLNLKFLNLSRPCTNLLPKKKNHCHLQVTSTDTGVKFFVYFNLRVLISYSGIWMLRT